MHAALLTPSKYIKAVEFRGKDVTLTIRSVKLEELEREDNTKERKGILAFDETAKGWVLNVTNVRCLVQMFGNETDNWIGRQVTLFPEANESSESGVAIRVRGSPELPADKTFILKLARKKPRRVTLKKTSPRGQPAPARTAAASAAVTPPSPPPAPAPDGDRASEDDEPDRLPAEDDLGPGFDGQPL